MIEDMSSSRLVRLSAMAALIGLAAGGAAYVLVHLIALLTNLALFHRWDWELPSFTTLEPSPWPVSYTHLTLPTICSV